MKLRDLIRKKEWAWRHILSRKDGGLDEAAKIALSDLRYFCNGTKSNFHSDALEMARMEGRREVFMRIMTFLNYDYSKIYELEEDYPDD
jgi:hypothetical protein